MLDENLPTFFLKAGRDSSVKHHEAFYFTQYGSEPEAAYALKHADPASPEARNTYAAALFDAHNPDVLFAEVLAKPGWTQPSLSQEEVRRNGGVPPPPQPIYPTEFAIQLYNPDQQIIVRQQTSKWNKTVSYEFSLPQTTFRTPSASSLDRSQDDPGADAATPKINFVWRKEGRIGKDMTCYMTGKSTDITTKKAKKNKEPDIAVAMFSGLKEMTIIEPNMYRVEIEDNKGLEVVLLLGAAAIRDMFFNSAKESFHIDGDSRKNSSALKGRKSSLALTLATTTPPVMTPQPLRQSPPPIRPTYPPEKSAALGGLYNQPPSRADLRRTSVPPINTGNRTNPQPPQRLDPRAQWEIDAETARLRAQVEAEAREQKRQDARARKRAEEEEGRKTQKFLEQEQRQRAHEEKERRRRQAEIDQETERLRRQFGDQTKLLPPARPQQQQRHSAPLIQQPFPQPQRLPVQPPRPRQSGPYLHPLAENGPAASQASFLSNGLLNPKPNGPPGGQAKMKKKSFWGLRSASEQNTSTLRKKQSSMF